LSREIGGNQQDRQRERGGNWFDRPDKKLTSSATEWLMEYMQETTYMQMSLKKASQLAMALNKGYIREKKRVRQRKRCLE
jgi:hypothetical protein